MMSCSKGGGGGGGVKNYFTWQGGRGIDQKVILHDGGGSRASKCHGPAVVQPRKILLSFYTFYMSFKPFFAHFLAHNFQSKI